MVDVAHCAQSILVLTGGLAGLWRHCRGGAATGNVFSSLAPSPCTSTVACQTRFGDGEGTGAARQLRQGGARRSHVAAQGTENGCTRCHAFLEPHLPPPRLSSHGPARFGLSPALPSLPPAPPAMPASSVCSGNASVPSLGALKRINVPFLFRYLRAYAWRRGPTPPLIELAEIDQLMVGIKISTSPATHTSPLPQPI